MSAPQERPDITGAEHEGREGSTGRAVVIAPYLTRRPRDAAEPMRSPQARLDETIGLAQAIELEVVSSGLVPLSEIRPSTFIGSGKVDELLANVKAENVELVVVDAALSPVQQRNLEKGWNCKVLDRTGLILEIFGRRARTKEGTLQVELAHLNWQKSRLVRSWTHLERQRGGFGFLGGPGETQIEADRRVIGERIHKIERELEQVRRTRGLHRSSRKRVPYPIIALVGYTNAGKSTLFNRLTRSEVLAADMLFATLDPTLRSIDLPHGTRVILSDTVGFVSELPTMLVAAFRATLEEVLEADVILHVRDISHGDTEAQAADVQNILKELGVDPDSDRLIEVWNKIDVLDADHAQSLHEIARRREKVPALVSALTGEGADVLLDGIEARISAGRDVLNLTLDAADGEGLHWLYEHSEVLARDDGESGELHLQVRVPPQRSDEIRRRFGSDEGALPGTSG
ncbi:GTPase HflX [Terrihabitans rhizophilus]|uniref:GTPase HflX n=1 Tax=Terrihabitans rhizophilus TaxID=3092662 RepID=UPI003CC694E2